MKVVLMVKKPNSTVTIRGMEFISVEKTQIGKYGEPVEWVIRGFDEMALNGGVNLTFKLDVEANGQAPGTTRIFGVSIINRKVYLTCDSKGHSPWVVVEVSIRGRDGSWRRRDFVCRRRLVNDHPSPLLRFLSGYFSKPEQFGMYLGHLNNDPGLMQANGDLILKFAVHVFEDVDILGKSVGLLQDPGDNIKFYRNGQRQTYYNYSYSVEIMSVLLFWFGRRIYKNYFS